MLFGTTDVGGIFIMKDFPDPSKGFKMDENFTWFANADLSKYEDKYIAIVDQQVVFVDEDPEVVYSSAKKKYPEKEVILWKVPHGDSFIF